MTTTDDPTSRRILLLMGATTYRDGAFLGAAMGLGLDTVRGLDVPPSVRESWGEDCPPGMMPLDFSEPEQATGEIVAAHRLHPFDAIVSVDDGATMIAAQAAAAIGLPHNDPASALAARDKFVMRERFAEAGVPVPTYRRFSIESDPETVAGQIRDDIGYPCVVKPLRLSGSRGVIRADDEGKFVAAFKRTRTIVEREGIAPDAAFILIERYLPGVEVALEGLLISGQLRVLALFDKPDPLVGPFFEETIYVTPSRLAPDVQSLIAERTAQAAAAVGLREGPVHAELRINDDGVWPIELAGRSIGGLCSTVLEFGAGISLEEVILRQAVGLPLPADRAGDSAAGVMMIPIPGTGMLRAVDGVDGAKAMPGITGVEISAKLNQPLVPLPEGSSYLGFIFSRAATPEMVEFALRAAHEHLTFKIAPVITMMAADRPGQSPR